MSITKTRTGSGRALGKLEVPGLFPDGSIPLEMLTSDLKIEIPNSTDIAIRQQIQLYIDGTGEANKHGEPHEVTQAEVDDPDHRFELSVHQSAFPIEPGKAVSMALEYGVYDPDTATTRFSRVPKTVIFDREAPGGTALPLLHFTLEQATGITEEDMTDDKLVVSAGAWYGMSEDDVITPWLGSSETTGALIPESAVTVSVQGAPVPIEFPRARLVALGNRVQYFGYQLQDKVGNASGISRKTAISVTLDQ